MVANWLKILLFAAGGSTAAAATIYYTGIYDPWATEESARPMASAEPAKPQSAAPEPASVQAEPQDEPETAADATETNDAPAADAASEDEPAPQVAAVAEPETSAQGADDLVVPSFDIVRVEPDGSMVIAGSAEPNSQVEVVAGADVIARADVGSAGDFAAVLDDALRPGDYQIVLRSTGPGEGMVTTSQETAIVSVPEDQRGDVLALVEEPGAPSRLITVPEGEAEAAETETPEPAEVAAADAAPQVANDSVDAQPATDDAAAGEVDPAMSAAPADETAPEEPSEPQAEIAARSQPEPAPTQDRPASPRNALAVEAIEIEGGTVFVAGRGAAGSTVRVYANEILLGEARVSEGGRFLIETQTDLPVGDYIVRADVIGPGGEVTARAAVPFQREPGEAVAAVAPAARTAAPSASAEPQTAASTDAGQETAGPADEDSAAVIDDAAPQASSPSPAQVASDDSAAEAEPDAGAPAAAASADPSAGDSADEIARAPDAPAEDIGAAQTGAAMPQAAAIAETMAEPLEAADGAVIIRRGDTLWRISRRVYGRGVRYSTIYLANQEQIRDPDMIWPGQVFAVPDETEEGEKADLSTVSDQLAPAQTAQ